MGSGDKRDGLDVRDEIGLWIKIVLHKFNSTNWLKSILSMDLRISLFMFNSIFVENYLSWGSSLPSPVYGREWIASVCRCLFRCLNMSYWYLGPMRPSLWLLRTKSKTSLLLSIQQTESHLSVQESSSCSRYHLSFQFLSISSFYISKPFINQFHSIIRVFINCLRVYNITNYERTILIPESNRTSQHQIHWYRQSWYHQVGIWNQSQKRRSCQPHLPLLPNDVLFCCRKRVYLQIEK